MRVHGLSAACWLAFAGAAGAADFKAQAAHKGLIDGFNGRDWAAVKAILAPDVVFHRANAKDVFMGPDAVVGALREPIADKWNVKFVTLNSTNQVAGKDGRVVERGDFAIT